MQGLPIVSGTSVARPCGYFSSAVGSCHTDFVFDWILGLACIVPVIIAMLVMGFMMNAEGRQFMKSYMTSLEEMNTEAVEYVRGIPVVKVFQQTIYSFKTFTAVS